MARSRAPVRRLTAADLGLNIADEQPDERQPAVLGASFEELADRDEVYLRVHDAMDDGFAGVILVGPPGSGKSYYAHRIAVALAGGDKEKVRFTQFHPSYQYEDFIEGWTPNSKGGFDPTPKHFRVLCDLAEKDPSGSMHVMVIDELSRCDAARVFGEALTYIETTKRGETFNLASGNEMRIPANIFIIATMNPWDRGVDEVDAALLRRFAQIEMPPSVEALDEMLSKNGLPPAVVSAATDFLGNLLKLPDERLHIGHAYFANARSPDALARLWDFQLHPLFRQATRGDEGTLRRIEAAWKRLVVDPLAANTAAEGPVEESESPPDAAAAEGGGEPAA
jgi:5-methylcytosine-specific restriction enzyme B